MAASPSISGQFHAEHLDLSDPLHYHSVSLQGPYTATVYASRIVVSTQAVSARFDDVTLNGNTLLLPKIPSAPPAS